MKSKSQTQIKQSTVSLNINLNKAKANGLNIIVNYMTDEATDLPTNTPDSLSITLSGEHHVPLPTLNNNQHRRLYEDFDLDEVNIENLDA
ncbi:MAG: hypothetical protein KAV87_10610, partial [Desulfobacteraceae bacterium]|nr:hypothetical protein [Desulfobacteraceae bacterium]